MAAVATPSQRNPQQIPKPQMGGMVSRRSVGTLAERLFRKHLAAQYVSGEHPFFEVEEELIAASVKDLRVQLMDATPLHLTAAGIHVHVMESVDLLIEGDDLSDVDEDTLAAARAGVEKASLELMLQLCTPE